MCTDIIESQEARSNSSAVVLIVYIYIALKSNRINTDVSSLSL